MLQIKTVSTMHRTEIRKIIFIFFFVTLLIKLGDYVIIDNFFPQNDRDQNQEFFDIFKDVVVEKAFEQTKINFPIITAAIIDTTTLNFPQRSSYSKTYFSVIDYSPQKIHIINSVFLI